ncbi:dTDP-4-dehydrorhamnose reductase [Stutzerimonas nitrititolerans]|uniref:dTDP-4-dehydrorhamnose reductase n=1 Tax=Stutzerimonas nitrititolerans TaxID=2482751 RepID=UPI0028A2B756|nr:dTDP-4-dehydrorhamnose reductase [Stutzerimonas nitrititolerans]
MPERVLVIGKNGQLGQSLQKIAAEHGHLELEFVGRDQLDLSCADTVRQFFAAAQPYAAIINAAAYTAVDKAESEPVLADRVNHLAVRQLAEIAREQAALLLHISTDYVFDGTSHRPWLETDPVVPVNEYGRSKLAGEQAILASGCRGAIVRTSWVYSEFGNNFLKTMLKLGTEREELGVIFDQVGTPTYATDLARALLAFLSESAITDAAGSAGVELYHYSNEGVCSWYDFARAIFELAEMDCRVNPIETRAYPTPASRPHYSVLNKSKIRRQLGITVPYWRDSLKNCRDELARNHVKLALFSLQRQQHQVYQQSCR